MRVFPYNQLINLNLELVILSALHSNSKFIISDHKFFDIINEDGYKVGEIEWGQVDNETIEIVSIHIDKKFRGKNYGVDAFESLVKTLDVNNVILKAATSRS